MTQKLFESDFLTVDVAAMFKDTQDTEETDQKDSDTPDTTAEDGPAGTTEPEEKSEKINWETELKKRLDDNKKLDSEARLSEFEIESKFFKEYYNTFWDADCAKQLMLMGEPLKKVFKVLGFSKQTNPILNFLLDNFVQTALIKTKLLNVSTFKAIYNAVAKRLVADSQFLTANHYNIMYCPDLYKRTPAEMVEYLNLQNEILSATGSKYTGAMIIKNKKVFLELPEVTEKAFDERVKQLQAIDVSKHSVQKLTLNKIEVANSLYQKIAGKQGVPNKIHRDSKELKQLATKLNTPAKRLATIQYLSMTTDSAEAKKALSNEKFGRISAENLIKATREIAQFMPKGSLATKDADILVGLLLSDL